MAGVCKRVWVKWHDSSSRIHEAFHLCLAAPAASCIPFFVGFHLHSLPLSLYTCTAFSVIVCVSTVYTAKVQNGGLVTVLILF